MRLQHRAASGLKWQALEISGRQLLSLAVFTILARLLQPSDFGLVGITAAYLAFIQMFVDQGIGTALVQRRDLQPQHLETAFWFNLACALVMCGATISTADSLARFAGDARVAPLLRWASFVLVLNALGAVHSAIFTKQIDFRYLTFRTWLANAVGGAVAILLAVRGYGVWALIVQQLIVALVGVLFLWIVSPWRPAFRFSLRHLRQLMAVSVSVFATAILWVFSSRVDQLVIGRFAGAATLGQYVVGIRLAEVVRAAIQEPISAVSMPALAAVQDDFARLRHALYRAMELHAAVCFAAFGGLAAVAPSAVPLVFGAQWTEAGALLQLVAIYSLAVALSAFYHPALLASGGPGRYVFISLLCAVGAATACLVGIQFGLRTLIVLLTLNFVTTSVVALIFLRQRIQLSIWEFCRNFIVPAIAAALMFISVVAARQVLTPVLSLLPLTVIEVAMGGVIYGVVLWILSPSTVRRLAELLLIAVRSPRGGEERAAPVLPSESAPPDPYAASAANR